jgi:hypothetical protein
LLLFSYSNLFSRHDAYSFLFNTIQKMEKEEEKKKMKRKKKKRSHVTNSA